MILANRESSACVSGSEAGPVPRYVSLTGFGDEPSLVWSPRRQRVHPHGVDVLALDGLADHLELGDGGIGGGLRGELLLEVARSAVGTEDGGGESRRATGVSTGLRRQFGAEGGELLGLRRAEDRLDLELTCRGHCHLDLVAIDT